MGATKHQSPPRSYRWRSSNTFVIATVAMAALTSMFSYSFIIPLLPYMMEERIGLDPSKTQRLTFLILAETALVSVLSSPVIGALADRSDSKKRFLLASLGLEVLSTVGLSTAKSLYVVFIVRFFQALADNSMWIAGLATVNDVIPSHHFGKVMGILSVAVSVGTSAGPVFAGILLERGGYWTAWSIPFALLLVDIAMRLLMVEPKKCQTSTPLLWLVGVPGDWRFPWASGDSAAGKVLYSVSVTAVGCLFSLLNGLGFLEATLTIDEMESREPGVFGPNGGHSRATSIGWMSWTLGMFLGPIVSGLVVEKAGYYELYFSLVGRSLPISVSAPQTQRAIVAQIPEASNAWFDGINYMRSQARLDAISSETAKKTSVAIIGGGIAGLMSSHLLSQVGIDNWHIHESSQRLGGRIRTVYLNDTNPEEYQYQEIGPMRIPYEIKYSDADEALPFADHRMVTRLVDALNEQNLPKYPELLIKWIPFTIKARNVTTRSDDDCTEGGDVAQRNIHLKHMSGDMYRAHKAALENGLTQWSEGGYLRYVLGARTNISNYLAATDQNPLWESLYWNDCFATASWRTIDKGFNSLPRAFSPYVANKTTFGCRVSGLAYNETTDKISVIWRDDPSEGKASVEEYDYAIVAAPFSKVRLWDTPQYSPLLRRAINEYQFDQSCKVVLQYKTRFWEHSKNPTFGGCAPSDIPGIGDVCYPSYALNHSGPGVVLASFNHGNAARSTAALSTEEHVARVQRSMEQIHGDIAREQYTGIYYRHCWENDEHEAGGWASPLLGQQDLFLPSFFRTEFKTIFIGLVDEAHNIMLLWDTRWINL
ncbi:hypothetical protein BBP40_002317 [Aspergillus hancockii]|nr:hypothetical protein BBP40_002317 [Aspergillus hancockii]